MKTVLGMVAAGLAAAALMSGSTLAQERIAVKDDWSIFEAGSGGQKICWIVSSPVSSRATRGGKDVKVQRGDIFLMVAVRPSDKVKSEVSFLSGYPFKGGSKVSVQVGSKSYTLFTDGENAWTSSGPEDERLAAAFRRGSKAEIKGESARGTTTRDTFSLKGFTAALKEAQGNCK